MLKLHIRSVTNALEHQLQLCKEDCCFVLLAKTIEDVPLLDPSLDILLLLSRLRKKH